MRHMSYENARQEMRDITGTITNIKRRACGTRASKLVLLFEEETVPFV